MMSGQSSSPAMHDACEGLGQNYLKADIIQWIVAGCLSLWRGKIGVIYYAYMEYPVGFTVIKR